MTRLKITRKGLWPWIRVGRGCLIGRLPGWRCWGRMLVNIESGKNLFVLGLMLMKGLVDSVWLSWISYFCIDIRFCGYSC